MRTFSLLVTDTRYSVPTLALLTVDDERQAIEQAKRTLTQSEFHRVVELHDGKRSVYREVRPS